ncbi:MAG TPA: uroporphyrinogen decarboxylase family protein [Chloroflexota bacterium]
MTDSASVPSNSRRERYQLALNHQEPDRVPIDLGSTGGGIAEVAYQRLKDHLGFEGDRGTAISATNLTVAEFDERVLQALDVDIRHLGLKGPRRRPARVEHPDGTFADEWGLVYQKASYYAQIVGNPLNDASLTDIQTFSWPDPTDPARVEGLADRTRRLYQDTDFGLAAKSVSGGTFLLSCRLRGMDRFLMDLVLDKPLAHAILERVTETNLGLYDALLSAVGPWVQVVETQDDLGTQRAPFLSPAMYQEMIQPYHARLFEFIRKKTGGKARIFMHSDGSIYDLLPHLIDAGVEVINPVQPQAWKMEPARLKADFGGRLTFHGGLDQQHIIPNGTPVEVEAEVREKIRAMAAGGGYIFSPCHNLQPDVPAENIVAMYQAAREFGRYPIQ